MAPSRKRIRTPKPSGSRKKKANPPDTGLFFGGTRLLQAQGTFSHLPRDCTAVRTTRSPIFLHLISQIPHAGTLLTDPEGDETQDHNYLYGSDADSDAKVSFAESIFGGWLQS